MLARAFLLVVSAVAVTGCFFGPRQLEDRRCDQSHECASGWTCVESTCVLGDGERDDDAGQRLPDAGPADAGPTDAGSTDAGPTDAGPTDAGLDAGAVDAGPGDSGVDDAGLGDSDGGGDPGADAGADGGEPDASDDSDAGTDGGIDGGADDAGPGPSDQVELELGEAHSCALLVGGVVKCWGSNLYGQLGLGDADDRGNEPNELGAALHDVALGAGRHAVAIAAGNNHTCAILDTGKVKCWGGNGTSGQLGLGDIEHRGDGPGEMGDDLDIVDLGPDYIATAIAVGASHTCVIIDPGLVKCWGNNSFGQLGIGNFTPRGASEADMGDALPVVQLGAGRQAVRIASSWDYTCVVLDDQSIKCWGRNHVGQLGLGDTESRGGSNAEMGDALLAVDLGTEALALDVTTGTEHTCALLADGNVKCWGQNGSGQLGVGDTLSRGTADIEMGDNLPSAELGTGRTAVVISTGSHHTCARLDDGTVKCWGDNGAGRLGYGDTVARGIDDSTVGDDLLPLAFGTTATPRTVAAGAAHTCVAFDDNAVKCWGLNASGQLGLGDTLPKGDEVGEMGDALSALDLDVSEGLRVVQIVTGHEYSCVLLNNGRVRCWGSAQYGRLGYGNAENIGDNEPASAGGDVDIGGVVVELASSWEHTCALLDNGAVRCWGNGAAVPLGYGSQETIGDDETPSSAGDVDVGGVVEHLAAGQAHTCALLSGGTVRCWGVGSAGQLGYANTFDIGDNESPASAGDVDVGGTVVQLVAAGQRTCARLDTNEVRCWGATKLGYPGVPSPIGDDETPASVGSIDVGGAVAHLTTGPWHTCALLSTDAVRCWGDSTDGRLGYGNLFDIGDDETPASAGDVSLGAAVVSVSAGYGHSCAVLDGGTVRCWGWGDAGRLGYFGSENIGDDELPSTVGPVVIGGTVDKVSVGFTHACAVLVSGVVRCWGVGVYGQLGYGNLTWIGDDETPSTAGNVPLF